MSTEKTIADVSITSRSGMSICKELFAEIMSPDYKCQEGKSQRQEFIQRAVDEAGMTKKGSETYWQSLRRQANGGQLYVTGKKKSEAETTTLPNAGDVFRPGIEAAKAQEAQAPTAEVDETPVQEQAQEPAQAAE